MLVRAGFDEPVDARGRIADAYRIERTVPTLRLLLRRGARLVLLAHRGQPHGVRKPALSLRSVATYLASALRRSVVFSSHRSPLPDASVVLLENLRFSKGEEEGSRAFARHLMRMGQYFVNDDFSTSHRSHASIAVLPRLLPAFAGLNLLAEMDALDRVRRTPRKPFVVVVGGAKISDKLAAVAALLSRVDAVLVGGAVACTLFASRHILVGASMVDADVPRRTALAFLRERSVVLPTDFLAGRRLTGRARTVAYDAIPPSFAAYDIGPASARAFAMVLRNARTVFWSGPLGFTEFRQFRAATRAVMRAIAPRAWSVVGGGDTIRFVMEQKLQRHFRFLSTGGSAMLAYVAGEKLPGIEALRR